MTRLDANRAVLRYLAKLTEANPELRFGQLASILDLFGRDLFYEESVQTERRAREGYERYLSLLLPEVFGGPDDPQDG